MSQAGVLNIAGGGGGGSPIESIEGNDGIPVPPTGNIIHLVGSGAVNVTGNIGTSTLTITVASASFTWNSVTSATPANPIQLMAQNGYICNGASLVTFLLPVAPTIGDSFIILSNTARFQITENGSQQICVGPSSSTAGTGNCTSNSTGDQVEFVYVGVNSGTQVFRGFAPQGTVTLN